ncbi:MAG: bifunctional diguanylate cyclase/phosphodiesterase [Bryobacterales bacterium]|nr:bifunctional diguanylate cyclase/phosphodiesterase [Bryobacterales bacterium]
MRLILTHGIASREELQTAVPLVMVPLEVVVAESAESVAEHLAEGDLNVVLASPSGDLAALREALRGCAEGERPLVLLVDRRVPGEALATQPGNGPTGLAALSDGICEATARPLHWLPDGEMAGLHAVGAQSAIRQGAASLTVADNYGDEGVNLREWLDALSRMTDGAVIRVEGDRCVALDASFPAKLGFRTVLTEGVRLGLGFAVEDRLMLSRWLRGGKSHPRQVTSIAEEQEPGRMVVTMKGTHGHHPVVIEWIPCTGAPISSRILLVSQARASETAQSAVSAPGAMLTQDEGDMDEAGLRGPEVFAEMVRQAVARSRAAGQGSAVLVCRLDGLDRIERSLGSEAAVTAFQTVATRLRRAGGEVDSMARLGPHEIAFVFVSSDPLSVIEQQILRFQRAMQPPLTGGDEPQSVALRFGISESTRTFVRPRALVRLARTRAAAALLLNHSAARVVERADAVQRKRGIPMEQELERACEQNELEIFLQPVVHLRTFQVRGAEVLVRWRHPVRGLLGPAHFLPLAESTGQVSLIGQWVLRAVCQQASHWGRLFSERARFAVNVSPVELHDDRFLANTLAILGQHSLGNAEVELEITETAVLASERKTAEVVEIFRRQGVRVALDDFGVGYSSLAHLREIPFSKLKIDRTFVHGSTASHRCRTIVRSMVELGRGLRVEVNAEGVETADQLRFLYESGCDEVQGYLFARPMPTQRFESWVAGYQGKALGAFEDWQEPEGSSKIVPIGRGRHG